MNTKKDIEKATKTLDELLEDIGKDSPFYYRAYLGVYRLWHNQIKTIPQRVRWFWQRGRHGFSSSDVWSIDGWFIEVMPKMLRELKRDKHGYPARLVGKRDTGEKGQRKGEKRWEEILEKMIYGLELKGEWEMDYPKAVGVKNTNNAINGQGEYYYNFKDPVWKVKFDKKHKEVEKAFKVSMELFRDYVECLWD